MLKTLLIRNFAIVESMELEFSGGFTAITGETGAGKSILVDALGLLIGNRAASDARAHSWIDMARSVLDRMHGNDSRRAEGWPE